ncbi:hypothetical protein WBG78_18920 [Chryseolinea sp. T2]|uniref:hypothetical protein n=1 Tax=Chryseolinea sp. T2 TaxID=3129255 RepID=UPI003076F492
MVLKLFKAVWFLSMLVTLAILLFNYAGLPETVVVQEEGASVFRVGRDTYFYTMTALIALVNVMVFPIAKVFVTKPEFRTWFYGLVIALNFFFIVSMNFVGLFNSGEKFDYNQIRYIVYFSVGLFIAWTISWPIYLVYKRFAS